MVLRGDNSYILGELSYQFENLNVFYKVFVQVPSMSGIGYLLSIKQAILLNISKTTTPITVK